MVVEQDSFTRDDHSLTLHVRIEREMVVADPVTNAVNFRLQVPEVF